MPTVPLRLLLVDDDSDDYIVTRDLVGDIGAGRYTLDWVETFEEAMANIRRRQHDVYFFDYRLEGRTGLDLLRAARAEGCTAPIIMLTGLDDRDVDVEVMKAGAADYLIKGQINAPLFERTIRHALDRKKLEDRLLQSQKLEVVGRLAGGVAHDFNNILTAVVGYSELLMGEVAGQGRALDYVRQIKKGAERATTLTSQLLAFSRKQIVQPKIMNLTDVVAEMDMMLRRLIGENVELVTLLAGAPCRIKIDRGQIEQVLANLAVNARDAMPPGGRLIIRTAPVTLAMAEVEQHSGVEPGSFVRLTVQDNGTGMTAEVQRHLFEPFFTTKPQGQGTGLGLATCYGIVRHAGGFITVTSEVGRGTTVSIHLPAESPADATPERPAGSNTMPAGTETILIAEDDPSIRTLYVDLLTDLGYKVIVGNNGEEALRQARQLGGGKVDLLLTDMVMPLMGGKELADHISEIYPQARVIFASGYTQDMLDSETLGEPGKAFLQKPFTPMSLAQKVRVSLDGPAPEAGKMARVHSLVLG